MDSWFFTVLFRWFDFVKMIKDIFDKIRKKGRSLKPVNTFVDHMNAWGLKYALKRFYIDYMPANPLYQRYVRSRLASVPRLQLGAGTTICPNWLHQDLKRFQNRKHKNLDITLNVLRLKKYLPNNALDSIFTSHMLEHLSRPEAIELLGDCFRWLKPKGALWISVPDLSVLYKIAMDKDTSKKDRDAVMMLISTPRPGHVSCWFYEDMKNILESLGFEDIQKWSDPPKDFQDSPGCWNAQIAGKPISLNILSIKKEQTTTKP